MTAAKVAATDRDDEDWLGVAMVMRKGGLRKVASGARATCDRAKYGEVSVNCLTEQNVSQANSASTNDKR
jgi:hypothetical protein